MESKLSDWLAELATGLEEGIYTVNTYLFNALRIRALEAKKLEEELEELKGSLNEVLRGKVNVKVGK